jgi:hypothetical protein
VSLDEANRGLDDEADSAGAEELPDEVDSDEVELDILSCESGRCRNERKYRVAVIRNLLHLSFWIILCLGIG